MTHAEISSWNKKWSVVLSAAQINNLRGSFCCVRAGFLPQAMSQLQISAVLPAAAEAQLGSGISCGYYECLKLFCGRWGSVIVFQEEM